MRNQFLLFMVLFSALAAVSGAWAQEGPKTEGWTIDTGPGIFGKGTVDFSRTSGGPGSSVFGGGSNPTIPFAPPGWEGGSDELVIDVGFQAGGSPILGCHGLDFDSFLDYQFNVPTPEEFGNFAKRYVTNEVSKFVITQIMATPELASLFETMQTMGNVKWEGLQTSCDMGEILEEANKLSTRRCVKDAVESGMSQVAAENKCNEPKTKEDSDRLKAAAEKEQADEAANGSTRLALEKQDPSTQAFSQCIPDECTKTMSPCDKKQVPAQCTVSNTFGYTNDVGTTVVYVMGEFHGEICKDLGRARCEMIAREVENYTMPATGIGQNGVLEKRGPQSGQLIISMQRNMPKLTLTSFAQSPAPSAPEPLEVSVEEFKKYIGCTVDDPLADHKKLVSYLKAANITANDAQGLAQKMEGYVEKAEKMAGLGEAKKGGTESLVQESIHALPDGDMTGELLRVAVGCTYNHKLRQSAATYTQLNLLEKADQTAFTSAMGTQIANLSTIYFWSYIKHKLLTTSGMMLSLKNSSEEGGSATPVGGAAAASPTVDINPNQAQAVYNSLMTAIAYVDNQLDTMERVQKVQDRSQEVVLQIHKRLEEMQQASSRTR